MGHSENPPVLLLRGPESRRPCESVEGVRFIEPSPLIRAVSQGVFRDLRTAWHWYLRKCHQVVEGAGTFNVDGWLRARFFAVALKQWLLLILQLGFLGSLLRLNNSREGLLQNDDVGQGRYS